MKNTLLILFLTFAFAFSSYARESSYTNKVLSVVTNGTEVITITETTNESDGVGLAFGIRSSYTKTVTTNVTVSTLPSPMTEKFVREVPMSERQKELEKRIANGETLPEAEVYAAFTPPKKEWRTSQKEAYRNAFEFLSKPISKKEEK